MTAHDPAALPGGVFRVHWVPGADRLLGVCYCGAEQEFEDPVDLWNWLLGHPEAPEPAERQRLARA
ncbi:hypothetical protein GCM10018793_11100 [Streptomyces sulfonofaciens]|uniref:Uncharacterized protein n=1 Tax=Streptomyces sulfonofaciens TaxID=68272 RepID=A0A919FWI2_9ACTN|nr:hypothetical protein [Streptomyces sulfonofaciens]GHH73066.1 hypothetical protein GCM10018793_11100 [Streptomyces sulfonofaciens]